MQLEESVQNILVHAFKGPIYALSPSYWVIIHLTHNERLQEHFRQFCQIQSQGDYNLPVFVDRMVT